MLSQQPSGSYTAIADNPYRELLGESSGLLYNKRISTVWSWNIILVAHCCKVFDDALRKAACESHYIPFLIVLS